MEAEVARLERRLSGPRRLRRDMVAEVRDGLHDAATAHEEAGLEPAAAVRCALEEFGDLEAVARELQRELVARQARRAALIVGLAFLPLVLAWDLVWRLAPHEGPAAGDGLGAVYLAVDLVQLVAGLAGAVLAVALRRPQAPAGLCRAAGLVGLATPAIVTALCVAMLAYGPWAVGPALGTPATALLSLASASILAASLLAGARCLRLSAGHPRAASGR
jgi:hypothetical protein